MRLHIMSDLHNEFAPFELPATNADVIILAGDIDLGLKGVEWAKARLPDKPILYTIGNHEYYGNTIPNLTDEIREAAAGTNVHVLENESISINDVQFLGCTLWTDFELFGDSNEASAEAREAMSDYDEIKVGSRKRKLRPEDLIKLNTKSKKWLDAELQKKSSHKKVVITHHAPSKRSIREDESDDLLSAAYASRWGDFVSSSTADLWIHGHIHKAQDYLLGQTRVICNPRGYVDDPVPGFDPALVIEI